MKNKKIISIVSIVLAVLIIFMSVGYAFFTESLTINGVASTVDFYEGDSLPTDPIIQQTDKNRYHTWDIHKDFVDFNSESWIGDTYTLIWDKGFGIIEGEVTITYTIAFNNPTELYMTDGMVTTEITQNSGGRIKNVSASISKTQVAPGESVVVSFSITSNFLTKLNTHEAKATISYMLQGKRRYLYFYVRYVPE